MLKWFQVGSWFSSLRFKESLSGVQQCLGGSGASLCVERVSWGAALFFVFAHQGRLINSLKGCSGFRINRPMEECLLNNQGRIASLKFVPSYFFLIGSWFWLDGCLRTCPKLAIQRSIALLRRWAKFSLLRSGLLICWRSALLRCVRKRFSPRQRFTVNMPMMSLKWWKIIWLSAFKGRSLTMIVNGKCLAWFFCCVCNGSSCGVLMWDMQ